MGSKNRGSGFQSRWGHGPIVKEKTERYTQREQVAYLNRIVKRSNKATGYETAKKEKTWIVEVPVLDKSDCFCQIIKITAHTKSEARAGAKKELGYPKRLRLPVGTEISELA